ncbi:MAG: hypothetical protein D6824_09080 [Planctomycetota bacterium]|nr:MAG: hypothetical protein D6824_09080 [Planctomycetota bacterium]
MSHAAEKRRSLRGFFSAALCAVAAEAGQARAAHRVAALLVYDGEGGAYQRAAEVCAAELAGDFDVVVLSESQLNTANAWRAIGSDEAGPDVYLAAGARSAAALAKRAPAGAPVRYCLVASPGAIGLLDRPNTVGVLAEASVDDQLRLLRRALPKVRRLGVLYHSGSKRSLDTLKQARSAAGDSLTLVAEDVARSDAFSEALKRLFAQDVDALWMIADPAVYNAGTVKATLIRALRERTPVFGFSASLVRAGAALGVQVDPAAQGRRLAELAREAALQGEATTVSRALAPRALLVVNALVVEKMRSRFSHEALAEAAEVKPR